MAFQKKKHSLRAGVRFVFRLSKASASVQWGNACPNATKNVIATFWHKFWQVRFAISCRTASETMSARSWENKTQNKASTGSWILFLFGTEVSKIVQPYLNTYFKASAIKIIYNYASETQGLTHIGSKYKLQLFLSVKIAHMLNFSRTQYQ